LAIRLICSPDLGLFGGKDFLESGPMEAVQDEEKKLRRSRLPW